VAKKVAYPGKLNKPLEPRDDDALSVASDEYPSEEEIIPIPQEKFPIGGIVNLDQLIFEKMWRPEFDEKFELLCKHFEIPPDDPDKWRKLALALAQNHVLGFQEKQSRGRGRHKGWNDVEELIVWQRFVAAKARGLSERSAAAFVARTLGEGFPAIRSIPKVSAASLLRRMKRIEKSFLRYAPNSLDLHRINRIQIKRDDC
jgi:hypothetical protein